MIVKKFQKIIASVVTLITLLAITPIEAHAEWKANSTGWWYTEGNSWSTGWRYINGNWYYFYSDGYMAQDTTINGYYVNSNGVWTTTSNRKDVKMNIKVNNTTFTATLEDNNTTKAFIKQLPLTVDMSDLNSNEKYINLDSNLRADVASSPGTINEGDLMLYSDNCLVLFYKTFNTSYSYVKLGHIDNTAGFAKAIGLGSAKVTFSVS
jgi:hypothetical protein